MSYSPRYDKGDWKAICDICGREVKATSLRKRWDGFMVCSEDWEPRHPQDFVRGVADLQAPTWTRPESSDTFVPINYTLFPAENLNLTENISKSTGKSLVESLSLGESVNTLLTFLRSFSETMSLSESVSSAIATQGLNSVNAAGFNVNCLG